MPQAPNRLGRRIPLKRFEPAKGRRRRWRSEKPLAEGYGRRILLAAALIASLSLSGGVASILTAPAAHAQQTPTLHWGSRGDEVAILQQRLRQWGYYDGPVNGVFGPQTSAAVQFFQRRNGLNPDGIVGAQTWAALGLTNAVSRGVASPSAQASSPASAVRRDEVELLSRVVAAEAEGEPFIGKVAVAAVVMNRVRSPGFPNTLSGVVYQPHAFESVSNGLIWRRTPSADSVRAVEQAMAGWDPTYGSLFFWNPNKPVTPWIWSRPIVVRYGNHVFAR